MKRFKVMHCQSGYDGNWRKVIIDTEAKDPIAPYSNDVIECVYTTEHDTRAEAVIYDSSQRRERAT